MPGTRSLNQYVVLLLVLAFLLQPTPSVQAASIDVTINADQLDADSQCSLREAIRAANLNSAVDTCAAGSSTSPDSIVLPTGVYQLSIMGANEDVALSGDLDITGDLTITGALSTTTIIDGSTLSDRVFDITTGTLTLVNVTVRNGSGGLFNRSGAGLVLVDSTVSQNSNSGIVNQGTLTLDTSAVKNNHTNVSGGGILNSGGKVTLLHSVISDNSSFDEGGGIANQDGMLIVDSSSISGNSTSVDRDGGSRGGGVSNNGTALLTGSTIADNTGVFGGGLANGGILTVTASLIENNSAVPGGMQPGLGGGIFNSGGPASRVTVTDSSITNNQAFSHGGGIYNFTWASIAGTVLANNHADSDSDGWGNGGGIYNSDNGVMALANSTLHNNSAHGGGGIVGGGLLTIGSTVVASNMATFGGGLISAGVVTITNSLIDANSATQGGGIANADAFPASLLSLTSSVVRANIANEGGGINNAGKLLLTNSAIISNTAISAGGAIYNSNVLTATNSTLSGNNVVDDGGGIYNLAGSAILKSATVANNTADSDGNGSGDGGGIARTGGTVSFQNTLIGGNADRGGQAPDCAGILNSQGYNLVQSTIGCVVGGSTAGYIAGQNPKIGPLRDNGGSTLTHALLFGSPAIDAGDPTGCTDDRGVPLTTDQRGASRPQGGACDIGAYEAAPTVATTTTLISSLNPSSFGRTIVFTATVGDAGPGTPSGSVTFRDGSTVLGSRPLDTNGQAAFSTMALATGGHPITAEYSGDASFSGGNSPALVQQVDKAGVTIAIESSPNPALPGQAVQFTVTVTASTSGVPTGVVTLKDGGVVLAAGALSGRKFTTTTAALAPGHHAVSAYYGGDSNFISATSSALDQNILVLIYLPLLIRTSG